MQNNAWKIFKDTQRLLRKYINFEMGKNAHFTSEDILGILLGASINSTFIETFVEDKKDANPHGDIPSSDDVFHHLHKLKWEGVKEAIDEINWHIQLQAKKQRLFGKPAVVAIDIHNVPYHGEFLPWIYEVAHENGTSYAYKIATIEIVEHGRRFTLYWLPFGPFDTKAKIVERLIEEARKIIRIRCLLVDRGFFSVDVIKTLISLGVKFLMPAIRNKRIKPMIAANRKDCIVPYTMGTKHNNVTFNLMFVEDKEEGETYVFATNMDVEEERIRAAANLYRSRWGIETGYRVKQDFRARTCSPSFVIRYLLLFLSIFLYNIWVLCNAIFFILEPHRQKPKITTKKMRREYNKLFLYMMDAAESE